MTLGSPLRLLITIACTSVFAYALPPIGPDEAVALVRFKTTLDGNPACEAFAKDGVPHFRVKGLKGQETVEAIVDARASRVLNVSESNTPVHEWPGIVTVGHRGTVTLAPENTISAFHRAIETGADLVEMDVRETKDGHLVIMHDQSVYRTTGARGMVAEMTLTEIQALDAGSKFGAEFAGEKPPTFEDAMAAIQGKGLPDIDFKAGTPEKVVEAVRRAGLIGKVTLYCGDWKLLKETLAIEPGFLIRPTAEKGLPGLDELIREFDPPIVNIDWRYFTEELVQAVHMKGKLAFINTMGDTDNAESMIRAIEAGADYIQTDHMDVLVSLLRERGMHK